MLLINSISRLIFPEYCFGCRKIGLYICDNCRSQLVPRNHFVQHHQAFDRIISFFEYRSVFQNILRGAKYYSVRKVLYDLADIAFTREFFQSIPEGVLIPVPIHKNRRLSRGFNQSEILAKVLAERTNKEVDMFCVSRRIDTPKQARLTKEERKQNIQGAFEAKGEVPEKCIIVDDVFTTGATCQELAHVLRKAGAKHVSVCTLAR